MIIAGATLIALAVATAVIAALETVAGLDNASAVYLIAVVGIAIGFGTLPAIGTAIGAFVLYNFFFVEPRFTVTVSRPDELVTLLLLLFVGIVSARLAGLQREREQEALRREREARALFGISRELATSARVSDAMQSVVERLVADTGMSRVWVALGPRLAAERPAVDSDTAGNSPPSSGSFYVLQRDREEAAATWTRIRPSTTPAAGRVSPMIASGGQSNLYRVELAQGTEALGSLWSTRDASAGQPHLEETRLLAAAADQLGQALRRERLQAQAAELEITRRSDELKSALLDSVSHDLRTPLATIRAAAGSLADPDIILSDEVRRASARTIDDEADRLDRLVGNLLDMSRIQGGALKPDLEAMPIGEIVRPVVERLGSALEGRAVSIDVPDDTPLVLVDAIFADQVVTNLIDNAVKHAPVPAPLSISATVDTRAPRVLLHIEDGGPGVPAEALPSLFEKFYRIRQPGEGSRRGTGLGLAVVRGLVEAMNGQVTADHGSLGGLRVTVALPRAPQHSTADGD